MLITESEHLHKFKIRSYPEPFLVKAQNENIFQSERVAGGMSRSSSVEFAVFVNGVCSPSHLGKSLNTLGKC